MVDIFDNTILCKDCNLKMEPVRVNRNGFIFRAVKCPNCSNKIIHPEDLKEFENFRELKNKHFRVKLRFVGNSYAVSIPREIIDFMNVQEKEMNDMVDLCMDEIGRLRLDF
jgi:hypothetical protein